MFTKRIIPCLDVNNGRVVKGVNFVNLRDAGDPVEIAAAYDKAGADEVVYPEKQIAKWTAIRYASDHILDYVEVDDTHAFFEVEVPEKWLGKTVGELDIRKKYNINIVAVKENGKIHEIVSSETVLTDHITLMVLGEYKVIQKCFEI